MIPSHCVPILRRLWPAFQGAANHYGVAPQLLIALACAESTLQPTLNSPNGAAGLMQMLPTVARDLARKRGLSQWNLLEPCTAIDFAARYLLELFDRFDRFDDIRLIIAAFKIGPDLIEQCGGRLPAYIPLRIYVRDVLATAEWLEEHLPVLLQPGSPSEVTGPPVPTPDPPRQTVVPDDRELRVLQTLAEGMRLSVVHGRGLKRYPLLPLDASAASGGDPS